MYLLLGMLFKSHSLAWVFAFSLTLSSCALASGLRTPLSGDVANSEYNKGKVILHKQVMCRSCPLGTINLNRSTAPNIMLKLKLGRPELGRFNRKAVNSMVAYLEYRFDL